LTADTGRRALLRAGLLLPGALAGAPALGDTLAPAPAGVTPAALAVDERYWAGVAAQYDMADDVVLLDNGYWGSMARPVLAAYQRDTATANRGNAWYGRTAFPPAYEDARRRTAAALGVAVDEIMLTRGATEALQVLIGGYNRLRPGDAVLYADIDYDGMINAMQWLHGRRGVDVIAIAMPEPATHEGVIAAYATALARNPRIRMMLLTHVNHRNGMVLPVADISRMARARGVDVIVDTAHGFGQLDMRIPDLDADFVGINLHKWIGAPVGVGAVYIRRGRVPDIDPYMGERPGDDIRSRVHTGTINFAACTALPVALALHQQIGVANKQARLRLLRQRWVDAARQIDGVDVLASDDPRLVSAIASFRLRGQAAPAQNTALVKRLLREHRIFTVPRDGLASGSCVRVTPAIFTSEAQVDRLVAALRQVARAG
jgi:isopenicillin-N epimerase